MSSINLMSRDRTTGLLWVMGVLLVIGLMWEAAVRLLHIEPFLLPSMGDVLTEAMDSMPYYLYHGSFTLMTALGGFVGAVILGVSLAVAIVSSPILDRIIFTVLALMHSIPKVAVAPLFVVWLGTGVSAKIAIAVLTSIFTIVIDVVVGMRSIDPEMVSMAKVKHGSAAKIMLKIRFPYALPNLFGALKAAVSFSLIGAIVGEFVGGQRGLGYVILVAQGSFETARAFVAILILGLIGTSLFYLVALAERICLPWHVSQRMTTATI